MERLLDCIAQMDYPKEKLEIQVLDDSTDESFTITQQKVKTLQNQGLDIQHITRKDRKNFKAGALKEGLETAKGEYIAIFDADFLPQKEWLKQTVSHFNDEKIGVVQTRWGHINRDFSLLTKAQAFALDYHFSIEQVGRNSKGHFINFNGTAGIWRKACIYDAGNWQGDTLTEDLDLSYRAQLKGWKIHYLEDVVTPAELPVAISAARSQQFRWNKGGAENFRKTITQVFNAKQLSFKSKLHATFHLLNSSVFLAILVLALLSVPLLFVKAYYPQLNFVFYLMGFFMFSTLLFMFCYWTAYKQEHGSSFRAFIHFLGLFFAFFAIAIGLSWNNAVAVLEGHLGKKSAFIRTPKFNINSLKDKWKDNKYIQPKDRSKLMVEGCFILYFAIGIITAFTIHENKLELGLLPFHILLFLGFGYVFFQSLFNRS
jgi:cellulose synthase/poly-beta-1,6-N-acetylglucosamine synthase-like glycosyltransferase